MTCTHISFKFHCAMHGQHQTISHPPSSAHCNRHFLWYMRLHFLLPWSWSYFPQLEYDTCQIIVSSRQQREDRFSTSSNDEYFHRFHRCCWNLLGKGGLYLQTPSHPILVFKLHMQGKLSQTVQLSLPVVITQLPLSLLDGCGDSDPRSYTAKPYYGYHHNRTSF